MKESTLNWHGIDSAIKSLCNNSLELFDAMDRSLISLRSSRLPSTYVPYNTIQTDTGYQLEFALAGFAKDEVKVSSQENILTITAEKKQKESATELMHGAGEASTDATVHRSYVHRGIASRSVTKQISLPRGYKVGKCIYKDGLLTIDVVSPEEWNISTEHTIE